MEAELTFDLCIETVQVDVSVAHSSCGQGEKTLAIGSFLETSISLDGSHDQSSFIVDIRQPSIFSAVNQLREEIDSLVYSSTSCLEKPRNLVNDGNILMYFKENLIPNSEH